MQGSFLDDHLSARAFNYVQGVKNKFTSKLASNRLEAMEIHVFTLLMGTTLDHLMGLTGESLNNAGLETYRSQFQQPLTPFHNPGFSTTPNPFALTNPFQKTGTEQQISKPTRSHNKRLNNRKPTANRSKRFREE